MFQVGDELGRYEIIAHLKSGGMAALYLGRRKNPPDNKIFAIKVVHPHLLDDQQLVQMFLDEARLSARIDHPNVVRVQEMGEESQMHYLVMEYVHGCSLAQLLQALIRRGRRMQPELAVHIAMNVAEGLHAAHETKDHLGEPLHVVHRDVSPQNVLLSHTGDVKLIDFGIAKSRARMHHSMTGVSIRGKLRYMSPEHARGKSVDRRTDVYALGIVLWEMLTMRPLFWAETDFDVLRKVQDPHVDPPSKYAPSVPAELDQALARCLARDRDERPYTAMETRQLLARALPFAEALDSEQVAELLDAVLGDEIDRATGEIPEEASIDMGLDSRSRSSRISRPVTQRAIQELTAEFRDEGISADSFAEDWDDFSESEVSTLDEAIDALPRGTVVRRDGSYDLSEQETPIGTVSAEESADEPTELMAKEDLVRLQSGTGARAAPPPHLMDIRPEHDHEETVVESAPPTFTSTVTPPLQDYEDEATTLKSDRGELLEHPTKKLPAVLMPQQWAALDLPDDTSAERMALIVGAAVAAVLLALVGLFILF